MKYLIRIILFPYKIVAFAIMDWETLYLIRLLEE